MEIRTYPSRNNYFNIGISEMCDEGFKFRGPKEALIVVCIAPWSVKEVVLSNWIRNFNGSRVHG